MGTKKKLIPVVSQDALERPRRYQLKSGKWVGIGGAIIIPERPPKLEQLIPAASQKELLEIAKTSSLVTTKQVEDEQE